MNSQSNGYMGLARKWRPQVFEDLVGQEHISRTLQNAIRSGRVGHSYLFTGTRGVGKTSTARLFAKAIRCENTPTPGKPCNQCTDCVDIAEGRSMNVLEIDGASNNGVDAVRELRENAKFLPSTGRYKIYIIDEVHMLTTAAFNALLKTLEEPPAHLVFILATTDPQKIPATVLGRCQRYDFRRVSLQALADRFAHICAAEGVAIDTSALSLLARSADGSIRDGLSLLDQVIAGGQTPITAEVVVESLGLMDWRLILGALEGVLKRQPQKALEAVGQAHLFGYDLKLFCREFLKTLRTLLVLQVLTEKKSAGAQLLELSDLEVAQLSPLVGLRSNDDLDMIFCTLNHALDDIARSPIAKTLTDVVFIKMAAAEELITVAQYEPPFDRAHSRDLSLPVTSPVTSAVPQPPKPAAMDAQSSRENVVAAPAPAQPLPTTSTAHRPVNNPQTPAAAPQPSSQQFSWPLFVKELMAQKPLLGGVLENATFEGLRTDPQGGYTLTLGFSKGQSFYKDQVQLKSNSQALCHHLQEKLGAAVRLEYKEVLLSSSLEDAERQRRAQVLKEKQQAVLQSEAMRASQEVLGARIEKLEIRGEL
jgi:DNA polymerase-3 subunit gamma/tau